MLLASRPYQHAGLGKDCLACPAQLNWHNHILQFHQYMDSRTMRAKASPIYPARLHTLCARPSCDLLLVAGPAPCPPINSRRAHVNTISQCWLCRSYQQSLLHQPHQIAAATHHMSTQQMLTKPTEAPCAPVTTPVTTLGHFSYHSWAC